MVLFSLFFSTLSFHLLFYFLPSFLTSWRFFLIFWPRLLFCLYFCNIPQLNFNFLGEIIRFRITGERFEETSPAGPDTGTDRESSEQKTPYTLAATISEPGLGLTSWWSQAEEVEEEGVDPDAPLSPSEE